MLNLLAWYIVVSMVGLLTFPLAHALFALDGVYNVLLAQDFVTVNKLPPVAWEELEPAVVAAIVTYLESHPNPV